MKNNSNSLNIENSALSNDSEAVDSVNISHTPAEALKFVVDLNYENELIFIQLDGNEVIQTYAQIWERAERILGGLRAFGLQPGDLLVLQLDLSQDFSPTIWSCIMGGFVPVPVPIAPDYFKPNQALAKLNHIWQQLDCPTVLTTSKLASHLRMGLQLYSEKKVVIATIDSIEAHSPDTILYRMKPHELALLLPSSGTTGKPKLIESNCRNFIARFLKNAFDQENNLEKGIFLNWFPLESISGIFITIPNGFQRNIHLPIELLARDYLLWLDVINNYRVTNTQTTNFILRSVIEKLRTSSKRSWDFSCVQKIGIGAETIVAKTARSFMEILGTYNLHPNALHPAYGMTECGPIAFNIEGFSLTLSSDSDRFVEIGKPIGGHSIRIVDQQGSILEEGQIGRIQVTGPSMTSGYYKAPELTRELFTVDGWINTGDLGFLQDGKLTVTGREKEIIIINARNYSCHEIELVAEEVEGVEPSYTAACAIRQSNSETDELVIFFHSIVSEESHLAQLLKQIRRNIAEKLGPNPTYLIPIEKSSIPRTSTGKIQRLQLKQRFEAGEFHAILQQVDVLIKQDSEETYVVPRTSLEEKLAALWAEVLDLERVGITDNFFDLGGDSLRALRLFAQIEKTFGKNLPLATLFQAPTVEELASLFCQEESSALWESLVPIQPDGSKPPLFCVHGGGGNVISYGTLARYLGSDQPLYGLQANGLDGKQAPLSLIEDIATHYIKAILTVQPSGPYFLGGHCFGGFIAFEMAQQLVAMGQKVALLALFESNGPNTVKITFSDRVYFHLMSLMNPSQMGFKEKLDYLRERVNWHLLTNRRIPTPIRKAYSNVHSMQGSPQAPYILDILEANLQASSNYVVQAYPGRVTLFRASWGNPIIHSTPHGGWGDVADGGVEVYDIPGDHMTLFKEPSVQVLAEKMRTCLDRAIADASEAHTSEQKKLTTEVEHQVSHLSNKGLSPLWSSLVPIHPYGSRRPFFGVHTDDGSVLFYRHLVRHLHPDQPFYGLQAPALDGKQAPRIRRIEELAAHYIKEIQTIQPEGPYLLGGFCIGGVIAFEMAQQLVEQGQQVALLALFDAFAPFPLSFRNRVSLHLGYFSFLEPQEKLTYLQSGFKRRIKLFFQTIQKIPQKFFPSIESFDTGIPHLRLSPYTPQVYPGRVTLFRASKQLPITYHLPDLGWGKLTSVGVEVHDIPGSHTEIVLCEPAVGILAEKLQACLDKAQTYDSGVHHP